MAKAAFLFPGQGAQYVGMGKDFYDQYSVAKAVFQEADDLLSYPFSQLIFDGSPSELALTKNSQIAIYVVSLAILKTVEEQFPELQPSVCAGLSLGEYTALTAAHKISFKDGLFLVQNRACYMHEACEAMEGAMSVVLGLSAEVIEQELGQLSSEQVWVANLNCPGQVVISGTKSGIREAIERLKARGAKRVLPLDVSGAFHSGLMQTAQDKLTPKILEVSLQETPIDLVMNVPGNTVCSQEQIRQFLIEQVTSPVRWEQGIRAMENRDIDFYLEMGPGKTLLGMNKKIGVNAPTVSVEKTLDLEQLAGLYATIER